jgi:hypothetical protein
MPNLQELALGRCSPSISIAPLEAGTGLNDFRLEGSTTRRGKISAADTQVDCRGRLTLQTLAPDRLTLSNIEKKPAHPVSTRQLSRPPPHSHRNVGRRAERSNAKVTDSGWHNTESTPEVLKHASDCYSYPGQKSILSNVTRIDSASSSARSAGTRIAPTPRRSRRSWPYLPPVRCRYCRRRPEWIAYKYYKYYLLLRH